jgi:hypothetical protein
VLGTLVAALALGAHARARSTSRHCSCARGALQCKAISLLWLAPLALGLAVHARRTRAGAPASVLRW